MRRFIRALLIAFLLAAIAGVVQFLYLAWRINAIGARDEAVPADAIVVLGARVEADGQPGPDLASRTAHAVYLYHSGFAPYLICTGGFQGDRLSAAAVAGRLALAQGVPAESILLADGSMTTREDAASALGLMSARGMRSAILVSHPLHLARARLLFEGHGIKILTSPTSRDLGAIPWRTRAWLTAREAAGIVWIGLEEIGIPPHWTTQMSRWFSKAPAGLGNN